MIRRFLDWAFRSRETGRITIGQVPNVALSIFLVAAGLRWAFDPAGTVRTGLTVIATAALIWWAADEIVRGVNPWRRALGSVVLALALYGLVVG